MMTTATALLTVVFLSLALGASTQNVTYLPNWDSLDKRPLPTWYDDAKVGIFLHWGVFSVPSVKSEWFWYYWHEKTSLEVALFMGLNYPPNFSYQDFAEDFTAEFYDPDHWADIFEASGARYVVLTSKHHEGFTLWPSQTSFGWNAVDIGPKRDLIAPLAEAVRKKPSLRFGLYHSLFEWFNPVWQKDKALNYTTNVYARRKALPELYDLVERYKPEVIWSDGEEFAPDTYWEATDFLAWLYNESPVKDTVVTNDRWGNETTCAHGDFYNCADRYSPGVLQPHKWENAMTIDQSSWGYRRTANIQDFLTIEDILAQLVNTVSCGGNILLNVGPTKEGLIAPIYEERLRQLGTWLSLNGEGIYGTRPWIYQNDTINGEVWYTKKDGNVYGLLEKWPHRRVLALGAVVVQPSTTIQLLSYDGGNLNYTRVENTTLVEFPDRRKVKSEWAYVVKFTNLANYATELE